MVFFWIYFLRLFRNGGPHWTKISLQFCSWVWKPGLQLTESLFLFPDVSGWNNTTFLFLWYPYCKFMWQYYSKIIRRSAPPPWNIFLIYGLNNLIILGVFQRGGPLRDPIFKNDILCIVFADIYFCVLIYTFTCCSPIVINPAANVLYSMNMFQTTTSSIFYHFAFLVPADISLQTRRSSHLPSWTSIPKKWNKHGSFKVLWLGPPTSNLCSPQK